jgi:hypothetical protein
MVRRERSSLDCPPHHESKSCGLVRLRLRIVKKMVRFYQKWILKPL